MKSIEQNIQEELNLYLALRGDRIATNAGLISLRQYGDILEAEVDGERFDVIIRVRRAA